MPREPVLSCARHPGVLWVHGVVPGCPECAQEAPLVARGREQERAAAVAFLRACARTEGLRGNRVACRTYELAAAALANGLHAPEGSRPAEGQEDGPR